MTAEPTHLRQAAPEELPGEWRTGTSNPWTIYVVTGEPTKQQPYVGSLLTPEASAMAVRDHNAQRDAAYETDVAYNTGRYDGAEAERERIAKGAAEMATTLGRPGLGNGPLHGEKVRMVRLDDLLDLINDEGEERT